MTALLLTERYLLQPATPPPLGSQSPALTALSPRSIQKGDATPSSVCGHCAFCGRGAKAHVNSESISPEPGVGEVQAGSFFGEGIRNAQKK